MTQQIDEAKVLDFVQNTFNRAKIKREVRQKVRGELQRLAIEYAKKPGGRTADNFKKKIAQLEREYANQLPTGFIRDFADKLQAQARDKKFNIAAVDYSRGTGWSGAAYEEKKPMSFSEFVGEDELNERLIQLNNGAKYNQLVIATGGAGSGKGFVLGNFVDSFSYKVRDVDEWKRLMLKIDATKKKYPEIRGLDLRRPADVAKLHEFSDKLGTKDKTLQLLAKTIPRNSQHKPNLYFDVTGKRASSVQELVNIGTAMGYEAKNIHILWILTDYKIAADNNAGRSRVVPEKIFMETHKGAAKTMFDIIGRSRMPHGMDGAAWVILNNRANTIFWRQGDGSLKNTPDFHLDDKSKEFAKAQRDPEAYDKIYGAGSFAKLQAREKKAAEGQLVVKSFMRIQVKKPGKEVGNGVLPWKNQLYNWILQNAPTGDTEFMNRILNRVKSGH